MTEAMQKCPGCGRKVPKTWAIPFTARWSRRAPLRTLYGRKEIANCQSCLDRPLDDERPKPPQVQVGQLWMSCDPRTEHERWVEVVSLTSTHAVCLSRHPDNQGGRRVKIRLDRFHGGTRGYQISHGAEAWR